MPNENPSPQPSLTIPRQEAERRIKTSQKRGIALINTITRNDVISWKIEVEKCEAWFTITLEMLTQLFDRQPFTQELENLRVSFDLMGGTNDFVNFVHGVISKLDLILDRINLGLIPDPSVETLMSTKQSSVLGNDVFIVHGHDDAAKESVARFVEKLGLGAIILHEQPNAGRTIIEKFEQNTNVGFAVVLITPDDLGIPLKDPNRGKPRARQNVIFELGYFIGKLGRGKVCVLHKGDAEIPSDFQGVLYIPLDSAGAWKMALAKEIKNTGIDVDLTKVI